MPLQETLPVDEYTDQWAVWGTTARIVLTDPGAVRAARSIVDGQLAAITRRAAASARTAS